MAGAIGIRGAIAHGPVDSQQMHPPPAVFYSWQSDLPSKTNRTLIEGAIEQAVKKLKISAQRSLRLDADTMDEPGSPNIPAVIFSKIPTTAIFVGDVEQPKGSGH